MLHPAVDNFELGGPLIQRRASFVAFQFAVNRMFFVTYSVTDALERRFRNTLRRKFLTLQ